MIYKVNDRRFCTEKICVWRDRMTGFCPEKGCIKEQYEGLHTEETGQVLAAEGQIQASESSSTGVRSGEE